MNFRKRNEKTDYWLSYADLMSGMLMIFVLLFSFEMLSIKHTEEQLKPSPTPTPTKLEQKTTPSPSPTPAPKKDKLIVRNKITEELKKELIKKGFSVTDKTGDIEIDSKFVFDSNQTEIKPEGKAFLDGFALDYFRILMQNQSELYEIVIEGHTDFRGDEFYNMELSQKRALSVYEYIFSEYFNRLKGSGKNYKDLETARKYISISGQGPHKPTLKYIGKQKDPQFANKDIPELRRINFRFRLKDEVVSEGGQAQ